MYTIYDLFFNWTFFIEEVCKILCSIKKHANTGYSGCDDNIHLRRTDTTQAESTSHGSNG